MNTQRVIKVPHTIHDAMAVFSSSVIFFWFFFVPA